MQIELDAEIAALRKKLAFIELFCVKAILASSSDIIDWETDVAFIGMVAKEALMHK